MKKNAKRAGLLAVAMLLPLLSRPASVSAGSLGGSLAAAVANINEVVELCNIGTLFAFILVAAGILILRRTDPQRPRPFRAPFHPWVPIGAIVSCGWLMFELPWVTWVRFFLWLAAGLVIYFGYSRRKARQRESEQVGK